MQDLYIDGNEEGPQIIAPTDERARAILDGFRMYDLLLDHRAALPAATPFLCHHTSDATAYLT